MLQYNSKGLDQIKAEGNHDDVSNLDVSQVQNWRVRSNQRLGNSLCCNELQNNCVTVLTDFTKSKPKELPQCKLKQGNLELHTRRIECIFFETTQSKLLKFTVNFVTKLNKQTKSKIGEKMNVVVIKSFVGYRIKT